jgi:hypothetical protein
MARPASMAGNNDDPNSWPEIGARATTCQLGAGGKLGQQPVDRLTVSARLIGPKSPRRPSDDLNEIAPCSG